MQQDFTSKLSHENNEGFSIALFVFSRYFDDQLKKCGLLCLLDCGKNFDPVSLERTGARAIYQHWGQTVYVVSPICYSPSTYLYPLQSHLLQTLEVSSISRLVVNPSDDFTQKIADYEHFDSFLKRTFALGEQLYSYSYPCKPYNSENPLEYEAVFGSILEFALEKGINAVDFEQLDLLTQLSFQESQLVKTTHTDKTGETIWDYSNIFLSNLRLTPKYQITADSLFYYYKKNRLCHFFSTLDDYQNLYHTMEQILHEQKQLGLSKKERLTYFLLYAFLLCGQPTSAYINTNGLYPVLWEKCDRLYTSNYKSLYQNQAQFVEIPNQSVDFCFAVVDDTINNYSMSYGNSQYHTKASVFLINANNVSDKIALIHNKTNPKSEYEYQKLIQTLPLDVYSLDFGNYELILAYKQTKEPAYKNLSYNDQSESENNSPYFEFFEPLFLAQIKEHIKTNEQKKLEQETINQEQPQSEPLEVFELLDNTPILAEQEQADLEPYIPTKDQDDKDGQEQQTGSSVGQLLAKDLDFKKLSQSQNQSPTPQETPNQESDMVALGDDDIKELSLDGNDEPINLEGETAKELINENLLTDEGKAVQAQQLAEQEQETEQQQRLGGEFSSFDLSSVM